MAGRGVWRTGTEGDWKPNELPGMRWKRSNGCGLRAGWSCGIGCPIQEEGPEGGMVEDGRRPQEKKPDGGCTGSYVFPLFMGRFGFGRRYGHRGTVWWLWWVP